MHTTKVKITNITTSSTIVILERNLQPGDYDYFVKEDVVRETNAYDMESNLLITIEEIGSLDRDNPDILEEIHSNLSISHDTNGFVNYIIAYWDPTTMLKKRYTMTATNSQNGAVTSMIETFFDTNGIIIETRDYTYSYDSEDRLIGRTRNE